MLFEVLFDLVGSIVVHDKSDQLGGAVLCCGLPPYHAGAHEGPHEGAWHHGEMRSCVSLVDMNLIDFFS